MFKDQFTLSKPVLFIVYNRLDNTKLVFNSIKNAQPPRLYIASDGPKLTKLNDNVKVENVRNYLLSNIDWDCKVITLFRNNNLGCGLAVSGAINWFFEHEEDGIILEDDCLPNSSFYKFCEILLDKYKYTETIKHICGNNFQLKNSNKYSYYFSIYTHVWGWATWKRAWKSYDFKMHEYLNFRNTPTFISKVPITMLDSVYYGSVDTWDVQWFFTNIKENGLSIIPNFNLIKNIGFSIDATHTHTSPAYMKNLKYGEIQFPLNHPEIISANGDFDNYTFNHIFNKNNLKTTIIFKIFNKLVRILNLFR